MSLSNFQERVKDREGRCAVVYRVSKSWTRWSDWTTVIYVYMYAYTQRYIHILICIFPNSMSINIISLSKKHQMKVTIQLWQKRDILGHHKHEHTQCTNAKTVFSLEIQSYSYIDMIFIWLSHDYSYNRFKCYTGLFNMQTKRMFPGILKTNWYEQSLLHDAF